MRPASRLNGILVLGMVLSASGASGEQARGPDFRFACAAASQVDKARAADLCAGFLQALRSQPDLSGAELQDAPLSGGPGLEIEITRATPTALEIIPTWIDAAGQRAVRPSVGLRTMDTTVTSSKLQSFFLRLLDDLPR